MMDLMFKATDKVAWDAFAATLPEGILIDEIGPIEGSVGHHVNIRTIIDSVDCAVLAAGGDGVEWINPVIVTSPERIWAGGMNYWMPMVEEPEA